MNGSEHKPSVVLVGVGVDEPGLREQLADVARVVAVEPELIQGPTVVKARNASVAVVLLDDAPQVALKVVKALSSNAAAVVISRQRNPDNILAAMRAGARDFAFLDASGDDLRRAIRELSCPPSTPPAGQRAKVISVFSAKGGSGATTLATNLAGVLASLETEETPAKVALLDFDLEMGDVLVFLDMSAPYSYRELLTNIHRLDTELLYRSLARHDSGVFVMSQTDYLEEGRELSAEMAGQALSFLKQHFDYIIIDGLRDFRDVALLALDKADQIILTMTQDIPALKNANRCIHLFSRLGHDAQRVRLALNRHRRSDRLSTDAISDALGRPVNWTVTNDFPTVIKAVNEGKLLMESSAGTRVSKDIADMASAFHEGAAHRKRGLFSRWGMG